MNSDILGILTRAKGGSFATFTFTSYLVILSMHSVNRLRRLIADAFTNSLTFTFKVCEAAS